MTRNPLHLADDLIEIQHNVWLLTLRGSLALCPKGNEAAKRVLDVGTGTGCWAIEYGQSELPFLFCIR
jgi:methylase of polypeptide subunit release factors